MSKQRDQMIDAITGMRIPVAANRVLVVTPENAAFIADYLLERNILPYKPTTICQKTNSKIDENYRNGWNECLAAVNVAAEEQLLYAKKSNKPNMERPIYIHVIELDCWLVFPANFFTPMIDGAGRPPERIVYPTPADDNVYKIWVDENVCLMDEGGDRIERNWEIEVTNNKPSFNEERFVVDVVHEEDGEYAVIVPTFIKSIDEFNDWSNDVTCLACIIESKDFRKWE